MRPFHIPTSLTPTLKLRNECFELFKGSRVGVFCDDYSIPHRCFVVAAYGFASKIVLVLFSVLTHVIHSALENERHDGNVRTSAWARTICNVC